MGPDRKLSLSLFVLAYRSGNAPNDWRQIRSPRFASSISLGFPFSPDDPGPAGIFLHFNFLRRVRILSTDAGVLTLSPEYSMSSM